MNYHEFLEKKAVIDNRMGFDVKQKDLHHILKPHQKDAVQWALSGGRRALFEAFGLGKTLQQLEIMRHIQAHEGGRQLIICPLGVRQEFKLDAKKMGLPITFIRWTDDLKGPGLYITNYESVRDGRLDVNQFNGVSLDEAAVLRSYGSKTYQTFLTLFHNVKYRFVATAIPNPNKYKELIHYAGYLGIMDTGQALTRFFKRDSQQANNLTIYPHKVEEFWLWVSTWALFLQKPSDLGYSDEGYDIPGLQVYYHKIETDRVPLIEKNGQYRLIADDKISLKTAAEIKRNSISDRVSALWEEIKKCDDPQYLIWCDLDKEQRTIDKTLKQNGISFVSLYGSTDIEKRDGMITEWKEKKRTAFVSKPQMYGAGINMQQCHTEFFVGVNFKFNDFLQAIKRVHRFQQDHECHIHIFYSQDEQRIIDVLLEKWTRYEETVRRMTELIKKHGLSRKEMLEELKRSIGVERVEVVGEKFKLINNDAVEECATMPADSVGLIHTSIPFANHYEYTPSYSDFGHTKDNAHFWEQMDYLTPHLFRILQPGRIAAVHVKDRILFGNVTGLGFPTSDNMHEECSFHFQKHGFKKIGMITVVTDVVRENNQTYRLGWTENSKDGSKMGVGCPEYVLIFRKPQTDRSKGFADIPVYKSKDEYSRSRWQIDAHAFWRSNGNRALNPDEMAGYPSDVIYRTFQAHSLENRYDYDAHVVLGERLDAKGSLPATFMQLAPASHHHDVWHDITRMKTLNSEQARRNLVLHICPLQFDIVDRIITRYSNKGDIIFDPFAGIGTVPYRAIKLDRIGWGVELNPESFTDSIRYCRAAEANQTTPSLFDFEKAEHCWIEEDGVLALRPSNPVSDEEAVRIKEIMSCK